MSLNIYEANLGVTCMDFANIPFTHQQPHPFFVKIPLLGVLTGNKP